MIAVRAVLFDVGGTLAEEPEIALGARLVRALGLDAAAATSVGELVLRHTFSSAADLAERLRTTLGRTDDLTALVRDEWDTERDAFVEIPDARTCVAAVANAGAKVGVLADLTSAGAEGFRVGCPGIVPYVEGWTLSAELGVVKPDPAIFEAALAALGVPAAAVLVVGDSLDRDVAPALALGMSAVWLRRAERAAEPVATAAPQAAPFPSGGDVGPEGAVVARTLSDVRRMALTWLWAARGPHGLTRPLAV